MITSTSIPGKLILLGEYAVLEGAPALVMAVNKYATINVSASSDNWFYLSAPNLNIADLNFDFNQKNLLVFDKKLNAYETNQLKLFSGIFTFIRNYILTKKGSFIPCKVTIDTNDFYFNKNKSKLGLGSSAAITVGMVKAIFQFNNIEIRDKMELFQLAIQAHFEAQEKIGSGIDIAASTFGGIGIYKNLKPKYSFQSIDTPANLEIIPIWTGSSTSTPEFVLKTKQFKNREPNEYNRIMQKLSELSSLGSKYFTSNEIQKFFKIIENYFYTLNELGDCSDIPIISEFHKKIAEIIKNCGGYYKPSGAGGSDIGVAFTNDVKIKNTIIEKIKNSSFKYIKLESAY